MFTLDRHNSLGRLWLNTASPSYSQFVFSVIHYIFALTQPVGSAPGSSPHWLGCNRTPRLFYPPDAPLNHVVWGNTTDHNCKLFHLLLMETWEEKIDLQLWPASSRRKTHFSQFVVEVWQQGVQWWGGRTSEIK